MEINETENQRLISDCQAEIAELEKALTTWGDAWIPSIQSKLKRQKMALASLTAEPDHYKIDVYQGDRLIASCHPSEPHRVNREVPFRFVETAYYTTPPAQILRPVELPQAFAYTIEGMEEYIDGWWLRKGDVIEALRQHGYEVKS